MDMSSRTYETDIHNYIVSVLDTQKRQMDLVNSLILVSDDRILLLGIEEARINHIEHLN